MKGGTRNGGTRLISKWWVDETVVWGGGGRKKGGGGPQGITPKFYPVQHFSLFSNLVTATTTFLPLYFSHILYATKVLF